MKSKTELAELIGIICNFYCHYRETLNLNHDEAKKRVVNMYDDLYYWLYDDNEQC